MNSASWQACRKDSVDMMPCVTNARVISVAAVRACRIMSWASGLVAPRMQSVEIRESSGTGYSGTARRMICVMGDVGDEKMLMPARRRAMERVMAKVMGDVEQERAATVSDWSW